MFDKGMIYKDTKDESTNKSNGGEQPGSSINHDKGMHLRSVGYMHHIQGYLTILPHGNFIHMVLACSGLFNDIYMSMSKIFLELFRVIH